MTSQRRFGRTLRSAKLRALLLLDADLRCPRCDAELRDDAFEADHVSPWSLTHRTNVHEMQALCPKCNHQKGSNLSD